MLISCRKQINYNKKMIRSLYNYRRQIRPNKYYWHFCFGIIFPGFTHSCGRFIIFKLDIFTDETSQACISLANVQKDIFLTSTSLKTLLLRRIHARTQGQIIVIPFLFHWEEIHFTQFSPTKFVE